MPKGSAFWELCHRPTCCFPSWIVWVIASIYCRFLSCEAALRCMNSIDRCPCLHGYTYMYISSVPTASHSFPEASGCDRFVLFVACRQSKWIPEWQSSLAICHICEWDCKNEKIPYEADSRTEKRHPYQQRKTGNRNVLVSWQSPA